VREVSKQSTGKTKIISENGKALHLSRVSCESRSLHIIKTTQHSSGVDTDVLPLLIQVFSQPQEQQTNKQTNKHGDFTHFV
jgi:hypothetical protein